MPRGAIERPPLVIVANTIIFIYSTVVITLLGTHVAPASGLDCGLRQRWQNLFRIKDSKSIKAIQDAFSCCGYSNPRDMAWPFQDKTHPATACQEAFARNTGCVSAWKAEEQQVAGLLMGVVGMIVLWAVCIWLVVSRAFTDYDASLQSLLSPLRAIRGFTKSFPSVSPA
jgi:predicted membrane protein